MEKPEKDACLNAFNAAYEILAKHCGDRKVKLIPISGEQSVLVNIPNPSPDPDEGGEKLTEEERVKAIEESPWARGEAQGLCSKLFGVEPEAPEYESCVKRVAHKLAVGMVT